MIRALDDDDVGREKPMCIEMRVRLHHLVSDQLLFVFDRSVAVVLFLFAQVINDHCHFSFVFVHRSTNAC